MNDHSIDESWFIKPSGVREKITAGGVVVRVEDDQLMIAVIEKEYSDGIRFSLPKGHVENGETLVQTAKREIYEETGIINLQLIQFLRATERFNSNKSAWKVTHFYLFVTGQINCVPLEDDKILRWFPIDNLPRLFWPDQSQLVKEHAQEIVAKIL